MVLWTSMKRRSMKAVEICKVKSLKYATLPGSGDSCCKMILKVIDANSEVFNKTFKLTLLDLVTFPDFLVERSRYEAAIQRNLTRRDKCKVWWRDEGEEDGRGKKMVRGARITRRSSRSSSSSYSRSSSEGSSEESSQLCQQKQRDAILEFKNEFEIYKPCVDGTLKTESWVNNIDCCSWEGIGCDAKFGNVIELNLSSSCLHGQLNSKSNIFMLQNLRFLDLSNNHFSGQILSSLGNLSNLTTLDLSENHFSGQIPSSLGNLLHLTFLDLTDNNFVGEIPTSLGNLSHLTLLLLGANKFVGEIPSSLGNLSHLTDLALCENNLAGEIPSSFKNLLHLTNLDLSQNNLVGEIPSFFGSFNQLVSLSVENNKFSGNFPLSLLNLTNLSELSLSSNQFTGTLPPNMSSLSKLVMFYAYANAFTGTIPSSLINIPSLTYFILSDNQLNGTLEFGDISSSLVDLRLGNNNFRGPIPKSISKLVNLDTLDLSHFNTQGSVDFNIFSHLKSLEDLRLSHLNTTTTIDLDAILSSFKSLYILDLSGNHVSATNKSSVSDPPLLLQFNLSGCGVIEFPKFLRTQQTMSILDISNNKINGQVPGWLWMLPNLDYVNLSNNTFTGFERVAKYARQPSMSYLFGSNNNFTGNIPSFICALGSLTILDLSNNKFNGSIPRCLGNFSSTLQALNLRKNHLSGGFPENISESLKSLDMGHNQLVGKLPRSLVCISSLEVLNVESNRINDTFPFWLRSLQDLQVLVLRANAFHGPMQQTRFSKLRIIDVSHNHFNGTLPSDFFVNWTAMFSLGKTEDKSNGGYMGTYYYSDSIVVMNKGIEMEMVRILNIFTSIDFSGNKFEGEIPKSIGLLKELHVLNLSSNAFTGHIPSSMANLIELESLDVSRNKLSGEIPQELGKLSYLAYMNFSHNQLVGLVPGGTQFQTQPCSSFADNPRLFGPSLEKVCNIHGKTPQQSEMPEPEEDEEEVISWIAAAIGFVPGIAFGLTMGYILVYYKPDWFMSPFGRNKRRSISKTH
ncbi:Leucine-rich repeat typical subtype [Arabidopsis thaliana x Arabidopsis arenosa]|uniref:Leucine-rich repeat typical subtype n=1 Tax=Arabidopsis thaliana x Arabidopsis arenosa TaxID=1240361 RepID=A0A8T2B054_9BRAS|nr:Leucine-rich repeat typical subtype [Arabidopsis thaliana x Arabidopsis arenosa]